MGRNDDGWHLGEGELLAPGLSALRRLGGGAAYEAWLCFDEVTWSPVVVKVLRPSCLVIPPSLINAPEFSSRTGTAHVRIDDAPTRLALSGGLIGAA